MRASDKTDGMKDKRAHLIQKNLPITFLLAETPAGSHRSNYFSYHSILMTSKKDDIRGASAYFRNAG
jgi:hypothetical protein